MKNPISENWHGGFELTWPAGKTKTTTNKKIARNIELKVMLKGDKTKSCDDEPVCIYSDSKRKYNTCISQHKIERLLRGKKKACIQDICLQDDLRM